LRENFDRFNFAIHKEKEMADFRRWILAFAALVLVLGLVAPASAQNGLVCTATASVTPTLRHEGFNELVGDILLNCVGAPGSAPTPVGTTIPQANVSVSLGVPITSRVLGGASPLILTEALLLVDDPTPPAAGAGGNQDVCPSPTDGSLCMVPGDGGQTFNNPNKYNVFQGVEACPPESSTCTILSPAQNSVTFLGVPVDPPLTSRTYRITNIRIDATNPPAGQIGFPIYAFVSSSSSTSIQISNPQLLVGLVAPGLTTSVGGTNPNFFECENTVQTNVGSVNFTENFATAFKVQTNGVQDVPGAIYNSESGLEIAVSGGTAGVADSPTELQTTITNIPTGAMVYVDPWAASGPASNANLVLPVPVSPCSGTACQTPGDPVLVADNSAGANPGPIQVVWAITQTNPSAIDSLTFKVYAAFTAQSANPPSIGPTTAWSSFYPYASSYPGTAANIPTFFVSSTTPAGTSLFNTAQCVTTLLFPYVTDFAGFDTGLAISNTSMDPLGTLGATGQTGTCSVYFYANGALATGLAQNGAVAGVLTSPAIAPGDTWTADLSTLDAGYPSASVVPAGYAIASCQFQFAHGYSFVSDYGVQNFAAAYLALIIPDAAREAQPFTCSANGGMCSGNTGEQLVH
jgi:hypothetical protein